MKKLLLTTLIATQCIGFTVYAKMNTNDRQNSDVSSIDNQLQDLSTSMHKLMQEINDLKKEKAQDQDRIMQLQSELENSQQQIEKIKSMNAHPHHKSKALITKIQDECKRAKAALDRMVPQAGLKKNKKSPAHKAKDAVQKKSNPSKKKVHKAVNQKIKSKSQFKKQQPVAQDSLSSMHDSDDEIMMAAQVDAMTQPVIISPESLDEQPQAMLLADDDDKNNDIEAVLTTLDNNQSASDSDNMIDLNVDINQEV